MTSRVYITLIILAVTKATCRALCPPGSVPCGNGDVCPPSGGNCQHGICTDAEGRPVACLIYQALHRNRVQLSDSIVLDQQQQQQQQHREHGHSRLSSFLSRTQPRLSRARRLRLSSAEGPQPEQQATAPLSLDIGLTISGSVAVSDSSNPKHKQQTLQHTAPAKPWWWLPKTLQILASHRRSLLQLGGLGGMGGMANILMGGGISNLDMAAGLGADGDYYSTYYNSLMGGGDSTDHLLQGSSGLGLGDYSVSYPYDSSSLNAFQQQQRLINAHNNYPATIAPARTQAMNTAQEVTQLTHAVRDQAVADGQNLANQAHAATLGAKASVIEGKGTIVNTVHPYVQNGETGVVDVKSRAYLNAAAQKSQFMHGTVVPMASGAITAASDVGNHFANGFSDGYPEGYQAAMDRRAPYSDAVQQQLEYQQQPALYLPSSFAPLGSFANVTYPCPQGPFGSVAPVGTIVGPGVPCGTNIMMVPRRAVPLNQYAPTIVQPSPTFQPVFSPPSPSPVPIPTTPLPPPGTGTSPSPGGGTPLPPNITPPNVRPSPAPGGTVIPTTPVGTSPTPTTPVGTSPTPTTPGTSPGPTIPGGLTPPNTRPASLNSYNNFMTYETARQQPQQQGLQGQQQWQPVQQVAVSGPYTNTNQAAAANSRLSGYTTGPRYYQVGGSTSRSGRSSSSLRQPPGPSLLSVMGRRLRELGF